MSNVFLRQGLIFFRWRLIWCRWMIRCHHCRWVIRLLGEKLSPYCQTIYKLNFDLVYLFSSDFFFSQSKIVLLPILRRNFVIIHLLCNNALWLVEMHHHVTCNIQSNCFMRSAPDRVKVALNCTIPRILVPSFLVDLASTTAISKGNLLCSHRHAFSFSVIFLWRY